MFDRHFAHWPPGQPRTVELPRETVYANLAASAGRYPAFEAFELPFMTKALIFFSEFMLAWWPAMLVERVPSRRPIVSPPTPLETHPTSPEIPNETDSRKGTAESENGVGEAQHLAPVVRTRHPVPTRSYYPSWRYL